MDYVTQWFSALIETHLSEFLDIDNIVDYKTYLQEIMQQVGSPLLNMIWLKRLALKYKKISYQC